MRDNLRPAFAEFVGTAMLLAAIVGSGIMGAKLAAGNDAIALLANALATGGALIALIASLAPVSGAHFNPAVTLFECIGGRLTWQATVLYVPAQIIGACTGVVVAHVMFELPLAQVSTHARATAGEFVGEIVATFGLLLTIWGVARSKPDSAPYAVAAYIVGAYWFTSSTSFANPAVTLARATTDTFAGIAPASVPGFVAAQILGLIVAVAATALLVWRPTEAQTSKPSSPLRGEPPIGPRSN